MPSTDSEVEGERESKPALEPSKTPRVYDMSLVYDRTIPERPMEKVNTLKTF
jgi:hypothetical protein